MTTARPLTPRERQLLETMFTAFRDREPPACTKCGTKTAFTEDWTLYPWPDGAWLCRPCNDARHDVDEYDEVERRERERRREAL
jgi:hypothetical protein